MGKTRPGRCYVGVLLKRGTPNQWFLAFVVSPTTVTMRWLLSAKRKANPTNALWSNTSWTPCKSKHQLFNDQTDLPV